MTEVGGDRLEIDGGMKFFVCRGCVNVVLRGRWRFQGGEIMAESGICRFGLGLGGSERKECMEYRFLKRLSYFSVLFLWDKMSSEEFDLC